jgi:hypothetical protein
VGAGVAGASVGAAVGAGVGVGVLPQAANEKIIISASNNAITLGNFFAICFSPSLICIDLVSKS